MICYRMT